MTGINFLLDPVVLVAFLFIIWYVVGGRRRRRAAETYVRTLGAAIRDLSRKGEKPSIRWRGQSAFQLTVDAAAPPFRRLEILVLLAPREVLPLWLLALALRRSDRLVVRADLRQAPRGDEPGRLGDGVRQLSFSSESPHFVAVLDTAWVRSHAPGEIARAIMEAARVKR